MNEKELQKIQKRLEKYREWSRDMPVGELISHKPAYKYVARDYCADVGTLMTALETCQQQLAEERDAAVLWMESSNIFMAGYTRVVKETLGLRAQLAKAQYSRLELVEQIATMQSDWGKCEAQLAASQAEVKLYSRDE